MNIFKNLKEKCKTIVTTVRRYAGKAALALGATTGAVALTKPAHAGIDELFAAVDLSGLATNIETLMIVGIGIMLLFIGYKKVKSVGNRV